MTPGLSEDLLEVNDTRKTTVINNELRRLQMDTVALQETRLPAIGSIREKDFSFFWQGKPPEEVREHGVGFAIRNRLLGCIVLPTEGSARIIKLQLHTAAGRVSLINAYAPTLTSSTEAKDKLYDHLGLALRDILQQEPVFLLGDFNARVETTWSLLEALDAVEFLPIMEELDLEPTVEEVEKAMDSLSSGKASGDDGIPPEVLK
ncbi:craniofacial development protein 2-like [Procambarus clarkii]|uniref:craniofacial development protein 2-like n=1 Tax=Procambarus clarkii TaxID=6728 RepID=UPI003742BA8D